MGPRTQNPCMNECVPGHNLIFHATFSGRALSWERSGAWERRKEPGKFPSVRRLCLTRGWQPIYKWAPSRANKSGDIRETFHPADNKILCDRGNSSRAERAGSFPGKAAGAQGAPGPSRPCAPGPRPHPRSPAPAAARLPVTCAARAAEPATVRAGPSAPRAPAPPPPALPASALACVLSNCSRSASRLWPGLRLSTRAGTFLMLFMLPPTVSRAGSARMRRHRPAQA